MNSESLKWNPDSGMAQQIDDLFDRAIGMYRANPNLIREHANHEESIRVGGYSNRTLMELVQNAADAMSGVDDGGNGIGRVEIVLDLAKQTVYCANAGRPFSPSGLTAVSHAHLSGKRGDEIGRFGLGFKSVLSVTRNPQVFSRSISFEFNSARAKSALVEVAPDIGRYPILRTVTQIDADAEFRNDPVMAGLAQWAATIVKLPNALKLESLKGEIESFRSEFLLFVNSVREVCLRVITPDEVIQTKHVSQDLGAGKFRIKRPNGDDDEWYVGNRWHKPSSEARAEVGDAVSRDRVKITIAMPARISQMRTGEFWSYFPLQDKTSASAIFNAPWSVNDDRTTLLKNSYNREILTNFAEMFVGMVACTSDESDPAAHLEYMPARGREAHSYGDEVFCAHIPSLASKSALVPDAAGVMQMPEDLRPLDFIVSGVSEQNHEEWIKSPNTELDVPHWRCYSRPQRVARLRQLYIRRYSPDTLVRADRDERAALEAMPKRGVSTWLREWAEGDDMRSAAQALAFVLLNPKIDGILSAKVVPTTDGPRAIADREEVFLRRVDDVDIEGASFVLPRFLEIPGIERNLRENGFRDLDPFSILQARLSQLSNHSDGSTFSRFWDAALDVPPSQARKLVSGGASGYIKVPTLDGGWAAPATILDIDGIGPSIPERTLDRSKCVPEVAHAAGVVHRAVSRYSIEDEIHLPDYHAAAVEDLNSRLGPGEHRVERIEFDRNEGAGPFSVLFLFDKAKVSDALRSKWTYELLRLDKAEYWACEDLDSRLMHRVMTPARWAVEQVGRLDSTHGFRIPSRVVSASLVEFTGLLPLFRGPRFVEDTLGLPKELTQIPSELLREALETKPSVRTVKNTTLVRFVIEASKVAFSGERPLLIPAKVGRNVEIKEPNTVYVATNEEQHAFLASRGKPYLVADREQAQLLTDVVGCKRFEDSFSFSIQLEGEQGSERAIDLCTGLRSTLVAAKIMHAKVTKAVNILKRVTTEDGVEDQSLEWHVDGNTLLVRADFDQGQVLDALNQAFDLRLSNVDIANVLKAGIDLQLEHQRQAARAATSDAERIEVFFGDETLRETLPRGLWQALESQELVDDSTSVANLFLTVYGGDSVRLLADQFRMEGYSDVPTTWAGGAATVSWLRRMGFGAEFAGRRAEAQADEFVVPGAVKLNQLHDFQNEIRKELRKVLIFPNQDGLAQKGMVELPTGAGKTRVATETVLKLFADGDMAGTVLWIAQSAELCEQAVQTFATVWRSFNDERPLTIGRLWESNVVHEPDTEFSVVVATDAKLETLIDSPEYEWLRDAAAVFIDEAHRAGGSKRYTGILKWLRVDGRNWERPLVGLSATPFKGKVGDSRSTKELAARFGGKIIKAFEGDAYEELAERGVLARVKHTVLQGIDVDLNPAELAKVRSFRKLERGVLERIGSDQARMRVLVNHILDQDPRWPILVFTPSVLSAQVLAATLRYRNVEAKAVSGHTGRQERRDTIEAFKKGDIQVLANCDLLIQGFDAPGVRALYIARPTFSPSAYIQMVGRGLRGPKNGGKEECLIVDMADNFGAVNDFLGYREYEEFWRGQKG